MSGHEPTSITWAAAGALSRPHPLSPSPFRGGGTLCEFDRASSRDSDCEVNPPQSYALAMDPLRRLRPSSDSRSRASCVFDLPPAERHAWTLLRNRGILGLNFRRQHVVQKFIVDFCCLSERIVIELEGDVHDAEEHEAYDRGRAELLRAAG